jgi:ABC-type Fe3+-hydroxamate transport system substrate-binding protein
VSVPAPLVDARGLRFAPAAPPRRIVSLVPSTTESLFALGAGPSVVGVTRFCVHPAEGLRGLSRVGGTKDLDLARLAALDPDLVLANAEENTREIFAAIEGRWPLFVAFPRDLDTAIADLRDLGRLVHQEAAAAALVGRIQAARAALAARPPRRALYLVWREPWMAVSPDTFISALLAEAGLHNPLPADGPRYPTLEPAALAALDPDLVLLSSEPFPFREKHRAELAARSGLPLERFRLVDGERCSWHGARLEQALPYLGSL